MSCDLVMDTPLSSVASVLTDVLLIPESSELLSDVTDAVGGACVEPGPKKTLACDWLVNLNQSKTKLAGHEDINWLCPFLSPWERTDSRGRRAGLRGVGLFWGRSQASLLPGGVVSPADA